MAMTTSTYSLDFWKQSLCTSHMLRRMLPYRATLHDVSILQSGLRDDLIRVSKIGNRMQQNSLSKIYQKICDLKKIIAYPSEKAQPA